MSGSVENLWALSIEENHLELAHHMAEQLNETKKSFDELVSFLKVVPVDQLHHFMFTEIEDNDIFKTKVAPVVESKIDFGHAQREFLCELN